MLSEIKKINKRNSFKTKGKLKYASQVYHNPFFNKKNRKKKENFHYNFKLKIILLSLILLIAALVWFLFYSNFFIIKNFDIQGRGMINPEKVRNYALEQTKKTFWVFAPQKNLFLFNSKKLKKILEEKYSFNYLNIKKKIPGTIKIYYSEKEYKMIWKTGETYVYADEKGNLINQVNVLDAKLKDYPIIEDTPNKEKIKNKLHFIFLLFEELKKYKEFNPEKFSIENDLNTIKLKILDGPEIYFNIDKKINFQIKKLLAIKEGKLKDDFNEKKYIDLRYGDSVYFR